MGLGLRLGFGSDVESSCSAGPASRVCSGCDKPSCSPLESGYFPLLGEIVSVLVIYTISEALPYFSVLFSTWVFGCSSKRVSFYLMHKLE